MFYVVNVHDPTTGVRLYDHERTAKAVCTRFNKRGGEWGVMTYSEYRVLCALVPPEMIERVSIVSGRGYWQRPWRRK